MLKYGKLNRKKGNYFRKLQGKIDFFTHYIVGVKGACMANVSYSAEGLACTF